MTRAERWCAWHSSWIYDVRPIVLSISTPDPIFYHYVIVMHRLTQNPNPLNIPNMTHPKGYFFARWFPCFAFLLPMIDLPKWMHMPHWVDNAPIAEELREYSDAADPSDTEPSWGSAIIHLNCVRVCVISMFPPWPTKYFVLLYLAFVYVSFRMRHHCSYFP